MFDPAKKDVYALLTEVSEKMSDGGLVISPRTRGDSPTHLQYAHFIQLRCTAPNLGLIYTSTCLAL